MPRQAAAIPRRAVATPNRQKGLVMKHSLTASSGLPGMFEILAAGLAAAASGPFDGSARAEPRRSLLDRLEHRLWRARQRELERQLASSVDLVDLEDRLRRIEHGMLHRHW
jgi:hypothetical protein